MIPNIILTQLEKIEPNGQFSGNLPCVSSTSGKAYYAKVGSQAEHEQFNGEVESLKALYEAAPGFVPQVLATGVDGDGRPFFVSEYKDLQHLNQKYASVLAKRLATEVHAAKGPKYGFAVPTFCGATRMQNGWFDNWETCFSEKIGDLLQTLRKRGKYADLCRKGEQIRTTVIPKLLGNLDIEPVLLHGDLWSGNAGVETSTGNPIIFDPSSYYGHNEADLAIARIFGGFSTAFFDEYHSHRPKTEPVGQYELRADLYELFHLLNHTVLFGGHYAGSAAQKMDRLLNA